MSEISDSIQSKCLAFSDRIIKLNDYLLSQAAMGHEKFKKEQRRRQPGRQPAVTVPQEGKIKHIRFHKIRTKKSKILENSLKKLYLCPRYRTQALLNLRDFVPRVEVVTR